MSLPEGPSLSAETPAPAFSLPVVAAPIRRRATAEWAGAFPDGAGRVSTFSHALDAQPYSADSRFRTDDGVPGTNPEELLAAAHASCYSMALAGRLSAAGLVPDAIRVDAVATLEEVDGLFTITLVELFVEARIRDVTRQQFQALVAEAGRRCVVTRALRAEVKMTATLV